MRSLIIETARNRQWRERLDANVHWSIHLTFCVPRLHVATVCTKFRTASSRQQSHSVVLARRPLKQFCSTSAVESATFCRLRVSWNCKVPAFSVHSHRQVHIRAHCQCTKHDASAWSSMFYAQWKGGYALSYAETFTITSYLALIKEKSNAATFLCRKKCW